ncbi:hypothetical protein [uncultured Maricaulis sp.]|uniref:hypothetical protein n=1 Tax=uncultured Maricaulis sp. TaxID=174710 RepID=UPI0030DAD122|tara:strand:- start:59566 stop:60510 length:945 start_codon:yes stop_codon:yes gene_type:complete
MHRALWWRDFQFEGGVVTVKKTGARLRLGPGLIGEVLSWLPFYLVVEGWRLRRPSRSGPKIWFAPDRPRPWYLIWSVLHFAGARIAKTAGEADAVFCFDDSTTCSALEWPSGARAINRHCQSIAKSHVGTVFERCFGYPLNVDPARFTGQLVRKSEANGAHDGRIVEAPCVAEPGFVYQKVIDNSIDGGLVEDLRCPTIGGQIPLVILKRRPIGKRFANSNASVEVVESQAVLSAAELGSLADFARAMQLDWGGLDVLRDKADGRLYVVDVNKTDMGPPIAMAMDDKIRVTKRLAAAFLDFLRPVPAMDPRRRS